MPLPLWKMTRKGWRAVVSYSQEGGIGAWRNETGTGMKEKQRWTVRTFFKVSVHSAAACCDMLMPFAVGLQIPLKLF